MERLLRWFFSQDKRLQLLYIVLLAMFAANAIAWNLARVLYEPIIHMPIPEGFNQVLVIAASLTAFSVAFPLAYLILTFSKMLQENEEIAIAAQLVSERKNEIFSALLESGVAMQHADKLVDLIETVLAHLEKLLPSSQLGIIIDSDRPQMVRSFSSIDITEDEQQFLLSSNKTLSETNRKKTWFRHEEDDALDWIIFPMLGRGDKTVGKLIIKSKDINTDQEEILSLFLEHLSIATENRLLTIELEKLANTDQLTGLFSRNYFQMELERQIELKEESNVCDFSILLVDINGLKPINDTIGHVAGDEMIIQGAKILQQSCRKEDWACRVGGDEFVVLCPGTTSDEAQHIFNRIMAATKDREVEVKDKKDQVIKVPLRMSVGLACSNEGKSAGVYAMADDRMYVEKQRFYAEKEKQNESV